MLATYLSETQALGSKSLNLVPVEHLPGPSELPPSGTRPSHARLHPFPDDVPFKLRHSPDDREHRLPKRRRRVQILLVGDEGDPEVAKLV